MFSSTYLRAINPGTKNANHPINRYNNIEIVNPKLFSIIMLLSPVLSAIKIANDVNNKEIPMIKPKNININFSIIGL